MDEPLEEAELGGGFKPTQLTLRRRSAQRQPNSGETSSAFCAEGVFRVDRSVARRAAVFDRRAAPTAEPVRRTQRRATSRACALGRIRRGLPGAVRAQDDVAAMTSERLPPRRPGA